jgi:hypothetical protein
LKEPEEEQSSDKDFREMLEDQGLSYHVAGQPGHGFQNQEAYEIEQVLSHAAVERPGRNSLKTKIIRKMTKDRIVTIYRVAACVLEKQNGITKNKTAK